MQTRILDDLHKIVLLEYEQLLITLSDFVIPEIRKIITGYLDIVKPVQKPLQKFDPIHLGYNEAWNIRMVMTILNYLVAIGKIKEIVDFRAEAIKIFCEMHNPNVNNQIYSHSIQQVFNGISNYLNVAIAVFHNLNYDYYNIYLPREFEQGY